MSRERIIIFGSGISGLVAAINLAKSGFEVEVREKMSRIGGSTRWHPSVHQQTFDLGRTSEYIGIDLSSCFHLVRDHTFYFYGRRSQIHAPLNYACEKGERLSSIESHLYSEANRLNINFKFNQNFSIEQNDYLRKNNNRCIVATGLEEESYQILGIKHIKIQGFRGFKINKDAKERDFMISYFGDYTKHDFAYVASFGDLVFSLLFSHKGIAQGNLIAFQKHLMESEGIAFDNWQYSSGCAPVEKNLVKDDIVLAGSISGMIDPFYLNGISAALISGKIASLYFIDREKAIREFNRFTRNFFLKKNLKRISEILPAKRYLLPLVIILNNRFRWVGAV